MSLSRPLRSGRVEGMTPIVLALTSIVIYWLVCASRAVGITGRGSPFGDQIPYSDGGKPEPGVWGLASSTAASSVPEADAPRQLHRVDRAPARRHRRGDGVGRLGTSAPSA